MSTMEEATIRVRVDSTNPGQFFACCGLLELTDRLLRGAEGWFEGQAFFIRPLNSGNTEGLGLSTLLGATAKAPLTQIDQSDDFASPVKLNEPFDLGLDWWKDNRSGGVQLKVWAGSMRNVRIASAMQVTLSRTELHDEGLLDYGTVVYDPLEPDKKVEPFYFDARRGLNAHPLDIGFVPDSLKMTTVAYPAVEFLCLVGLQRFRPIPTKKKRVFEYWTWTSPLANSVAPLAVNGLLPRVGGRGFRFEIAFRTDQKKHKAFTLGIPIERRES